jgi:pimeloyl-ACP methyl ester carboxylesterase
MRTLVLLPGFMCDADLWTDMVPDLGKIGHLHYGNVYADDTLEGMARRVLGEAPERFVLVGFSMGGFVARVLTLMAPERVQGVAFVATSAREYTMEERERRQQGFLPGNRPKANGNALGLHPDRDRDPVLLDRLRGMQRRLGPEVRKRQSALIRKDGYEDLKRIACPALVIACRQDRLRKMDETERMARNLPNARFEVLEDCGHMAPLEKPHELAALLGDWIEQLSS